MLTFAKRLPVFMLAGLMIAFIFFANSGQASSTFAALQATPDATPEVAPDAAATSSAALPATKPVVFGMLNNNRVDGEAGSYCWPDATDAPQCDFKDNVQPTNVINVDNGDAILFTTDPEAPAPSGLHGTLLDDKNADGDPREIDLTATGGIFTVENLSNGSHRLQVDALYPGTEQNQPFVAYVFLLTVGQTPVATEVSSEATEVVDNGAEPTDVMPEVNVTESPTEATAPETTETVAELPTEAPAETQAAPVETAAAPTQIATQAAAQPTAVPTVVPTVVPPTVAPNATINADATAVPAPVSVSPIGTAISATVPVPPATIIVSGRSYEPIAVNVCAVNPSGETVCVNRPANSTQVRIFAAPGEAAQVAFSGPHPTAIVLTVFSSDGSKVIGKVDIRPDNLILYNLPAVPGNYVISVEFTYPDGKASYFYRLAISG
jgi:hypothetical protein